MSDYNYVVTAHKPTAVADSVVGSFTSPDDRNLIVSKCTRVEIYKLSPEGVQPMFDFQLYGRIASLKLFRPPGENQDWLFILTERYKICVLAYDASLGEIVTKANGDVQDRIGRETDYGQIGIIDPQSRMLGLHLYYGMFKVVHIDDNGQFKEAFNLRLEQLKVHDIVFLHGCKERPTIAVLFEDTREQRNVHCYEIALKAKELVAGPWKRDNLEAGASSLVAVPEPLGGVIVLGETTLTYVKDTTVISLVTEQSTMKAYGLIDPDGSRFLLGDYYGTLYVLILESENGVVTKMNKECLGKISIPNSLSYLDNGYVFVGSGVGDSQIIKLQEDPSDDGQYFEVIKTFQNLGPIIDLDVVNLEQGQGQVVTCSGSGKDGSVRIIRNGIGINEQASVELPGIKGMWALPPNADSEYHKYLIQTFYGETRILALENGELEETEFPGLASEEQSLLCGLVAGGHYVQVTEKSVRLIDCTSLELASEWKPSEGSLITVAAANSKQVVVALSGKTVVLLDVAMSELTEAGRATMEHEVSCLNIDPVEQDNDVAQFAAIGLWKDMSVRVLSLPSMEEVTKVDLGGEVIARSVMFAHFGGVLYLLAALGDGHLFTFVATVTGNEVKLSDKRKLALGTQPIDLTTFSSKGTQHVFAASDRPTVVYSSNNKLLYSNVNMKEVNCVSPFITAEFGDSLAIASENMLTIGTIDDIQKLHVRTIPLGETPRCIAYQKETNTFAVSTLKSTFDETGEEIEESFLKLIDETSHEVKDTFTAEANEQISAVMTATFGDDPTPYYVAGTAFVYSHDSEPEVGRLLILSAAGGQLKLVGETRVHGAVYNLNAFNGQILAGINSRIMLYSVKSDDGALKIDNVCGHHGHILALYLRSVGDFIVVGDLMKSISLLQATQGADGKTTISEIARDPNANWTSAVEILDNDIYLGAENSFNLFTVKKNSAAATDEERSRLETVGEFHLGEFVNKFRAGSLVMAQTDSEDAIRPSHLFGTINGVIGVIAPLPAKKYEFLKKVQGALTKVVKGVGGLAHDHWRSFSNERKTKESFGFIDGDLVECYLDLPKDKQAQVADSVKTTPDELSKVIEDLSRVH